MTTLSMRAYAGETDLLPITELLNLCDSVDKLDDNYDVEDLRTEFSDPRLDPSRDLQLWEDAGGQLIAFGQTWIPKPTDEEQVLDAYLYFRIHPEARGNGLEADVISWGEQRVREASQERGLPAQLRSGTRDFDTNRLDLLDRHGFKPERYFFTMACSLNEPIPEPQFPEGYTLRHVENEADVQLWVDAFNLSFIDHWNFHPTTFEIRQHWRSTDQHYVPERDLILIAPEGVVAAFNSCYISPTDNARNGRNEGWIGTLGTRRGYRKRGLGRAMLLAGMHRLKADGVETAKLGVDAENPSGALGLYESVGFARSLTWVTCVKDL